MKRKPKSKAKGKTSHSTKSNPTSPIVLRRLLDLEQRMRRLEEGHSGDPNAHAALANQLTEQPASDAAEAADAPAEEQA